MLVLRVVTVNGSGPVPAPQGATTNPRSGSGRCDACVPSTGSCVYHASPVPASRIFDNVFSRSPCFFRLWPLTQRLATRIFRSTPYRQRYASFATVCRVIRHAFLPRYPVSRSGSSLSPAQRAGLFGRRNACVASTAVASTGPCIYHASHLPASHLSAGYAASPWSQTPGSFPFSRRIPYWPIGVLIVCTPACRISLDVSPDYDSATAHSAPRARSSWSARPARLRSPAGC